MSGSFNDLDVPPTLVSFALSMTKASRTGVRRLPEGRLARGCILPLPVDEKTRLPRWKEAG